MDLLPNDNYFIPEVPENRQAAEDAEQAKYREAIPLLEELLQWFDKQADEANRITALDLESNVPVQSQIIAMNHLAQLLKTKKGELAALEFSYKRRSK